MNIAKQPKPMIFSADDEESSSQISFSNVMETIPTDARTEKLPYKTWKNKYKSEWRWRFMDFDNGKSSVEISYITPNNPSRLYYNNKGEWVERDISSVYDDYVSKTYYYYSTS